MNVQEQTLKYLTQCPLMDPAGPSSEEMCANALASWVLRQAFENKLKGKPQDILHTIRGKVLEFWSKVNKVESLNVSMGALARTSAFRIFNLVLDFEVIHLEQPYNLILSGYTIQGKYALLRKRKGECLPYVLILHSAEPSMRKEQILPPDIATLSRYLHAHVNGGHTDVQVLHYPVFRGNSWYNKSINITLAVEYLKSALKMLEIHPEFPSAGDHCARCVSKPCLQVFKNQWTE